MHQVCSRLDRYSSYAPLVLRVALDPRVGIEHAASAAPRDPVLVGR